MDEIYSLALFSTHLLSPATLAQSLSPVTPIHTQHSINHEKYISLGIYILRYFPISSSVQEGKILKIHDPLKEVWIMILIFRR